MAAPGTMGPEYAIARGDEYSMCSLVHTNQTRVKQQFKRSAPGARGMTSRSLRDWIMFSGRICARRRLVASHERDRHNPLKNVHAGNLERQAWELFLN